MVIIKRFLGLIVALCIFLNSANIMSEAMQNQLGNLDDISTIAEINSSQQMGSKSISISSSGNIKSLSIEIADKKCDFIAINLIELSKESSRHLIRAKSNLNIKREEDPGYHPPKLRDVEFSSVLYMNSESCSE